MTASEKRHPLRYAPVALVTGAAKRIGRAIACELARSDWDLAIHFHHSGDAANELVEEIAAGGARAQAFQADLSREEECAALVERVVEAMGPLGCLVNNASVFQPDASESATRKSWDLHLEPNLRAPLVLAQGFARSLPEGYGGVIVNLLDQRVFNPTPNFFSYTISKCALWTMTQSLALSLAPRVRVNAIAPGPTLPSLRQQSADFERQLRALPLGLGPSPEEIGQAVRFILQAHSMTGHAIVLDGGQRLGWAMPSEDETPVE